MGQGFRKRRRFRWTEERRARVLEVLGETGNASAAADAVGTGWSSLGWLRKKDSEFDRQCRAASEAAHARLSTAGEPFVEGDGFHAIQRTSNGRYQLTAVRKGYWTKRHDEIFFTRLRRTGNIGASARAAGFDESTAWDRYYKWPAFAQRWEQVLDEASLVLEFRLACEGNQVALQPDHGESGAARPGSRSLGSDGAHGNDGNAGGKDDSSEARFDPERALRFLKWREDKKMRGRRRGPVPRRPGIEEVAENIIRKVEAIKRHRKLKAGGGAGGGEG